MSAHPNPNNPGHLIMSAYQTAGPGMMGSGTLVNLRFNVVGTPGQSTAVVFENYTDPNDIFHPGFWYLEGYPTSTTTNGSVTVAPAVSGIVTYGNAPAGQTRFVSDALIHGQGSSTVSTSTDFPSACTCLAALASAPTS